MLLAFPFLLLITNLRSIFTQSYLVSDQCSIADRSTLPKSLKSCFTLHETEELNWNGAIEYCCKRNATLAILDKKEAIKVVQEYLTKERPNTYAWISLRDLCPLDDRPHGLFWMCGRSASARAFRLDTFTFFEQMQNVPQNSATDSDAFKCFAVNGRSGRWKERRCLEDKLPFICEYNFERTDKCESYGRCSLSSSGLHMYDFCSHPIAEPTTTTTTTSTSTSTSTTTTSTTTTTTTTTATTTTTSTTLKPPPMTKTEVIISTVFISFGCTVNIVLMVFLLSVFFVLRIFHFERILHMVQELAFLIVQMFLLWFREKTDYLAICETTGVALQYFLTVYFFFCMLEAIQFYCIISNVIHKGSFQPLKRVLVFGLGVPLLVTILTKISYGSYQSEYGCWVNFGSNICVMILGPIFGSYVITLITMEATGMYVAKQSKDTDKAELLLARFNQSGMAFILPLNGAAMFLSMFAVYFQIVALYTVVFGLNIAGGVSMYVFHTVGSGEFRATAWKILKRSRKCWC